MKKTVWIFTLFLIGTLIASCNKSNIEYDNAFDKSFKTWKNFKESSNNSYRYKVVSGSWIGTAWETVITVTNGKVTQRHFKYIGSEEWLAQLPQDEKEWIENENEINSHEQITAAEGIALDKVYEKAKNDWLLKRENAKVYFESKNNGMLSTAGYVDNKCADDCFTGITIESIEAL